MSSILGSPSRALIVAMAICLALGIALLRVSPGGASTGTVLNVQGGQIPANQSASTSVAVSLVATDTMNAFDVTLTFDPAVVQVASTALANGWSALPTEGANNTTGSLRVAGLQLGEGCPGGASCPLFTITWNAVGSGSAGVAASSVVLAGSNGGTLGTLTGVTSNVGSINVPGGQQTPATSSPATSTQPPATSAPATTTQPPATSAPATTTQAPATSSPATATQAPATGTPSSVAPVAPIVSPTLPPSQPNILGPGQPPAPAQPAAPVVVPTQPSTAPSGSQSPAPIDIQLPGLVDPSPAGEPGTARPAVPLPPAAGSGFAGAPGAPLPQALGKSLIALAAMLAAWLAFTRLSSSGRPLSTAGPNSPMTPGDLAAISRYLADAEQRGRVNAPPLDNLGSTFEGRQQE